MPFSVTPEHLPTILRVCDIIVSILFVASGIFGYVAFSLMNVIVSTYVIFAGLLLIAASLTFLKVIQSFMETWFKFLEPMHGRGAYIILFGSLSIGLGLPGIIMGSISLVYGACLIFMSFALLKKPPPPPITEVEYDYIPPEPPIV
eukprot:TRINITY_DN19162_c0_g1_i1.p1 TRINITY_DN19162_c0_g1~~TRINITY_DN19162_c0_g1_i1.p1  ORF type:complete len:146 (-),score=13.84 TRINITY_DN19162_c0_g1_i1:66-503(-)